MATSTAFLPAKLLDELATDLCETVVVASAMHPRILTDDAVSCMFELSASSVSRCFANFFQPRLTLTCQSHYGTHESSPLEKGREVRSRTLPQMCVCVCILRVLSTKDKVLTFAEYNVQVYSSL